jgi:MscS family membrane protein
MSSLLEQGLTQRKPVLRRGFLRSRSHSIRAVALAMLLVAVSLWLAVAAYFSLPANQAQGVAQEPGGGMGSPIHELEEVVALAQDTPQNPTGEPPPTPDETAEPIPSETPGLPTETAEPTPDETPEPPPETTEPTPGEPTEPEVTAEPTLEPEETIEPAPTEPPAATLAATATSTATTTPTTTATGTAPATATATATRTYWPLGTIRFGTEESAPPAEPLEVAAGEWLRLALALVVVALIAILGGRLLFRLLRLVITHRHLPVDEALLEELKPLLSWWLAAIGFNIAVWWVGFKNEQAVDLFSDLAFLAYLGVATLTVWRLVDRAIDLYSVRIAVEGQAATVVKLRPILRRWARVLILLISTLIGLGRLQVGFSVPTVLLILLGLTIGLAARDTLTDIIAGFFILIDQPFRIGDRVEVEGVDTWADVVNIGLRTSVLRTRHHVEIIVPNATINNNQVINYSYPDSRYRMQTHVEIAFGTDVEHARRVMINAVRQADYVLPGEPVDALYAEIGDSGMIFRVRWWIDFYRDWERAYDCVHTALRNALSEAGIESPYPSQTLDVDVDDRTLADVWLAWQGEAESGSTE